MLARKFGPGPPRLVRVRLLVFGVGDVSSPVRRPFGDRQMGHKVLPGRAMPVLFAVRRVSDVARPDLDGLFPTGLDYAPTFGDVERLASFVGVPSSACPGAEVHGADAELGGRLAMGDRVDPYLSGEPLGRTFAGRLL